MTAFQVDLRVPACAPAPQVAAFIADVEKAGFAGAFVPDSHLQWRDVYVTLALAAQGTKSITLGTGVTNFGSRHPSVTAAAIQTLAELAPERLCIVVGRGHGAYRSIGRPPPTASELRRGFDLVRRLLRGESVDFNGRHLHLSYASRTRIPMYLAATGPRTLELAGEIADGVLAMVGLNPATIARARALIAAGARRAGRDPGGIDVAFAVYVHPEPDMETAYEEARPICASWVLDSPLAYWLKEGGPEVSGYQRPPEVDRVYPDLRHAEDWNQARKATAFLPRSVVAAICDRFLLVGPPERWAQRLQEAARAGAHHIFLRGLRSYSLPREVLRAFAEVVFPALRR